MTFPRRIASESCQAKKNEAVFQTKPLRNREAERRKAHVLPMSAPQTSLRYSSVRGGVPCGTPPFGAHACGTRHRLLPRWLSSRTGFPAASADGSFARFAEKLAAVKHAPRGPVLMPVDRGPKAARERIGRKIRARGPHLAFAVSVCRPERRPAQKARWLSCN
jgi:hypothetical protein